jgi:catechol 2,3-dioxygenase-like lactoylglutathione lyase family enzyme
MRPRADEKWPRKRLIDGLDHVDIFVKDLDEYVDFLQKKLGLEMVRKTTHRGGSVEFRTPPMETIIELHQTMELYNPEINHIVLRVSNIQEAHDRLKSEGVLFDSPPKFSEPTGRWIANTRLPDGRRLQLTSMKS